VLVGHWQKAGGGQVCFMEDKLGLAYTGKDLLWIQLHIDYYAAAPPVCGLLIQQNINREIPKAQRLEWLLLSL